MESVDFIVYSSAHGELGLSYELLEDLILGKPLSPTQFSQSVHNSIPGFFTIETKNNAPTTSIAAGKNSLLMGIISALNHLYANPCEHVLVIYSDARVPQIYEEKLSEKNEAAVISMILKKGKAFHFFENQKRTLNYNEDTPSRFISWITNTSSSEEITLGSKSNFILRKNEI